MALDTFQRFSRLPPEIQYMVWEFSVDLQPRTIEVRLRQSRFPAGAGTTHDYVGEMPSILHTCHDSRTIALKVSLWYFSHLTILNTNHRPTNSHSVLRKRKVLHTSIPRSTHFTSENVTHRDQDFTKEHMPVVLSSDSRTQDRNRIQKLMIDFDTATNVNYYSLGHPKIFMFPNLKDVTLIKPVFSNAMPPHRDRFAIGSNIPGYWQRQKSDSSATAPGLTHVIQEQELIANHLDFHNEPCCSRFTYAAQISKEYAIVDGLTSDYENGVYGNLLWSQPTFHFKGVSFDRIEFENLFHHPFGNKIHNTRRRKERVEPCLGYALCSR